MRFSIQFRADVGRNEENIEFDKSRLASERVFTPPEASLLLWIVLPKFQSFAG